MTLPDYIEQNMERLISEWIEFARTRLPASEYMGEEALSDGSKELMKAVVADMKTAQSDSQQHEKSRGERDVGDSAISETARKHAAERLKSGFTLDQVVAEYRALRASVIRCWTSDMGTADRQMLDELTRFNEGMDQSLTEAVRWFQEEIQRMRDTFVGILGHDLRDPLSAAITANELQQLAQGSPEVQSKANATADKNLKRMVGMVHDLLDFARTRLDGGLPITVEDADMAKVCREITEALKLSTNGEVRLDLGGDLTGKWDTDRIKQAVSNLLKNALQHGDANSPVEVTARSDDGEIAVSVHNEGPPIPFEEQHVIFDPLRHSGEGRFKRSRQPYSLGLGLYIVKQIVDAHGGLLELESSAESGTTFTMRLPKEPRRA